jgi:hypothetical protein
MRMLSIRGNDFIAHWAYEERIFAHAQPAVKCEQFLHVNPCWAYAERISSLAELRGTNFIAGWVYAEWISSLAEHTRKYLKVEYLGRIEHDFQKSSVIGPWDHKVSVSAKNFKKILCLCTFKGTQDWDFFWFRFWNLYFLYKLCQNIKILQNFFFDQAIIGGDTIFPLSLRLSRIEFSLVWD